MTVRPRRHSASWKSAELFLDGLSSLELPDTFNPWRDTCPEHDRSDAPAIRRGNLLQVLGTAIHAGADHLWVGRDLGYLGGRRTGLAMTDDPHVSHHARMWGLAPMARATVGEVRAERTAQEIWTWLGKLGRPAFLWNVFPLHPHLSGTPHSNRLHTRSEREAAIHFLEILNIELRPKVVVAIGKDAQRALDLLGIPHVPVRHPSYGGLTDFRRGMADLIEG